MFQDYIFERVHFKHIQTNFNNSYSNTWTNWKRATIGGSARISSTINTIIKVTITITTITFTITIATINHKTGATSVINEILLIDTGAATIIIQITLIIE